MYIIVLPIGTGKIGAEYMLHGYHLLHKKHEETRKIYILFLYIGLKNMKTQTDQEMYIFVVLAGLFPWISL